MRYMRHVLTSYVLSANSHIGLDFDPGTRDAGKRSLSLWVKSI